MNRLTQLKKETLSTEKMEERFEAVKETIARFHEVEQSDALKEYNELKAIVESKSFQEKKNYLLKRKYSDTEEGKKMRQYTLLGLTHNVRWFKIISNLDIIVEYLEFAKTEEYRQLRNPKAVKENPTLRKYKLIDGSQTLRRYKSLARSNSVRTYEVLKQEISTEDFQERNAFWKNKDRWYTTPESQQDAKYTELRESDDIKFYLQQDPKQIEEWEKYTTLYNDEFEWMHMSDSAWEAGFYYDNKKLKTNHSYANELQANNNGHNSFAMNSILTVEVKQEDQKAMAWDEKKGFVEKGFEYTGDVIQTANKFKSATGYFMAKVRFNGKSNGAVYLGSGSKLPIIRLAQFDGKNVHVGMTSELEKSDITIGGIKPDNWYVYSVVVTEREITWYINNQELYHTSNKLGNTPLYPAVAAYLPNAKNAGEGNVEIDWVRVYSKSK